MTTFDWQLWALNANHIEVNKEKANLNQFFVQSHDSRLVIV